MGNAAPRNTSQIRQLTRNRNQAFISIDPRDRLPQPSCVRMGQSFEERIHGSSFDSIASVHDRIPIGYLGNNANRVRNQYQLSAHLLLERLKQF